MNSKKGTIVHKITYEQDGDKYVDMIVGDTSIARILEEGLYDDLRNLDVRCYDLNSWLDSCAVCRLEVPKNLVNWRTEDVDICPLEGFDCGGLCTLKSSWDLFMEWRAREESKKRIEEACANCDDDLPF